jgi:hypothetical protein
LERKDDDLEDYDREDVLLRSHLCAGGSSWRPHRRGRAPAPPRR